MEDTGDQSCTSDGISPARQPQGQKRSSSTRPRRVKPRACLYEVIPAGRADVKPTTAYQPMRLPDPPQLAPAEKKVFYQADTTGLSWGTLIVFSRDGSSDTVRCWGEHYVPTVFHDRIGYDIRGFVGDKAPPAQDVYTRAGIPEEDHGRGLDAIGDQPKGGKPRCAYTTLLLLVLISSPRKCLLGYEIIAILMGHFESYRNTKSLVWQDKIFGTLCRVRQYFACLPAPPNLADAERIWYIDYVDTVPPPSPPPYGKCTYPQYRDKKRKRIPRASPTPQRPETD